MSEAKSLLDLPDAAQRLAGLSLAQALTSAVLEDFDLQFRAGICVEEYGPGAMIWLDAVKARRLPEVLWEANNRDGEDFAIARADLSLATPASRVNATSHPSAPNQDDFCRCKFPTRLRDLFHRFLDLLRWGDLAATGFEVATQRTLTIDAGVWRSGETLLDFPNADLCRSILAPPIFTQIRLTLPATSAGEQGGSSAQAGKETSRSGREKYPWDQVAILYTDLLTKIGWPSNRAGAIKRVRSILLHCRSQGLKFEGGEPKDERIVAAMEARLGLAWTSSPKGNKTFRIQELAHVPPLDDIDE